LIERRDARDAVRDVDRETERLLERASMTEGADPIAVESVARELATARRNALGELVNDASRQVEALFALRRAELRLLEMSLAYRSFIRERILWVRSLPADRGPRVADIRELGAWAGDRSAWAATRRATANWLSEPGRMIAGLLIVIGVALGVLIAPRREKAIAERLRRPSTDSVWFTVPAVVWAVVRALPVALALFLIGVALRGPDDQPDLGLAAGQAFAGAGVVWFGFALLRSLSRPRGVADLHFRWPAAASARLRNESLWAGVLLSASMAVMAFTDSSGLEGAAATVGRLGFSVGAIATAVYVLRVLRPSGPIIGAYVSSGQGEWARKFRLLWFWPLVALPVAFVVIAWLGYVYTAYQLSWLLALTFFLIVIVAIGNMFLRRWLFVARRRLAIEDARRRRAKAAEQAGAASAEPTVTETGLTMEDERLNLAGLSAQARQLIRVASVVAIVAGLVGIWGEFLPALRLLERVELYPNVQISDAEMSRDDEVLRPAFAAAAGSSGPSASGGTRPSAGATDADFSTAPKPGTVLPGTAPAIDATSRADRADDESVDPVTLADVGLSILFLLGTIVAFRNLPGLIEIVLLQRLPLDAGSRYAIDTVLKYAIAIAGLFATLGALGISWSNIQWLAAALTFGLAFGLQEIFANFISGLIILAERPIRIGDTVTVQNVSGTVTRIRMRATTITDWERKELVIPNKAFITGDVVNWTLSDPVLRVSVPVGVSYDTDIDEAERLLLSAASSQDNVLGDPAPYVNFAAFGESTLDLELRVFVPHIDFLLSTRHALHKRVISLFREAGIEIAFPQRDLHVRSADGLGDLVRKRESIERDADSGN